MSFVSADHELWELCEFLEHQNLSSTQLITWSDISFPGAILTLMDCGKPLSRVPRLTSGISQVYL